MQNYLPTTTDSPPCQFYNVHDERTACAHGHVGIGRYVYPVTSGSTSATPDFSQIECSKNALAHVKNEKPRKLIKRYIHSQLRDKIVPKPTNKDLAIKPATKNKNCARARKKTTQTIKKGSEMMQNMKCGVCGDEIPYDNACMLVSDEGKLIAICCMGCEEATIEVYRVSRQHDAMNFFYEKDPKNVLAAIIELGVGESYYIEKELMHPVKFELLPEFEGF